MTVDNYFSSTCYLPSPLLLSDFFWSCKHFWHIVLIASLPFFQSDLPLHHHLYFLSVSYLSFLSFEFFTSKQFLLCASSPPHTAATYSQWNPTHDIFYNLFIDLGIQWLYAYSLQSSVQICHDGFMSNCDPGCCHISAQHAALHIQWVEVYELVASVCSLNSDL